MKKLNPSLVLGAALTAFCGQAMAELRVVVTPTRTEQAPSVTPNHISVITSDDIQKVGANTVLEALDNVGSINVTDFFGDGSRASVDIRGFGATASSNVLVLVDGRELNNSDLSSPEWSTIPVQNIERIEVIQGGSGSLYGDKAVGGVINVILKDPQKFSGSVKVGTGSFSRKLVEGQVQDKFDNGLNYRVSAKSLNTDNYRENNDVDYSNVYTRVGYKNDLIKSYIELQRTEEDVQLPGGLTEAQFSADPRQANASSAGNFSDTQTDLVRVFSEVKLFDGLKASLGLSREDSDGRFRLFGGPTAEPNKSERDQSSVTSALHGEFNTSRGALLYTVGGEFEEVDYINGFGNTSKRESKAVFAHAVVPLTEKLSVTSGTRQAEVKDRNSSASSSVEVEEDVSAAEIGVNFKANDKARIFARIDKNFRFANLDEINFIPSSLTQLKPQEGTSYEFGGDFDLEGIAYKITFYHLDLENELAYDPTIPNANSFSGRGANTNLDDTERNGVIVEAKAPVTDRTDVIASYSYVDAEFSSGVNKGKTIAAVPEETAKLAVNSALDDNFNIYAELLYTGNRFLQGDFSNANPQLASYVVANANMSYKVENLKLGLKVNNLFDKDYAEYAISGFSGPSLFPSPARNIWMTVEYAF